MALRLMEGFNYDGWEDAWANRLTSGTSYIDLDDPGGRNGTRCVEMFGFSAGDNIGRLLDTPTPEDATMVVGLAVYPTRTFDDNFPMVRVVNDVGDTIWEIRSTAVGTFGVYVGGVEYGSVALSNVTWQYLEVVVDMDAAAGSVTIFKDGVQEHQTTGIDTKDATGDVVEVQLHSDASDIEWKIDDLYVLDDQGGGLTSRLGDVHVETLWPDGHSATHADGVGSDGNSTDNHLLVDDGATIDEADYVELQTALDRDAYTVPNLGAGIVPKAVQVVAWAGRGDGVTVEVDGFLRLSATDYDAADAQVIPFSYGIKRWVWDQNPNTAADWAEDDLDGVEVGIERWA